MRAWVQKGICLLKLRNRRYRTLGLLALTGLLAGCRVLGTAVIVTVGVVGLAGYVVYKTGEVAVTGVSKGVGAVGTGVVAAGSAVGSALTPDRKPESTAKPVTTVVFTDNEVKTDYLASSERTWKAANAAFQKAGFKGIVGERDANAGVLTAQVWEGTEITMKLKSLEPLLTEVRIRVGSKGNIKTSETVHKWIRAELNQEVAP